MQQQHEKKITPIIFRAVKGPSFAWCARMKHDVKPDINIVKSDKAVRKDFILKVIFCGFVDEMLIGKRQKSCAKKIAGKIELTFTNVSLTQGVHEKVCSCSFSCSGKIQKHEN